MKRIVFRTVLPLAVSTLVLAAPLAHAGSDLPPTHQQGGVDYMTGGIGSAESTAMRQASPSWPLTLEFAVRNGRRADYAADVAVELRDAQQRVQLQLRSDGPFVLARVAPGRYTVSATLDGTTLRRTITVRRGHPTRAIFLWPDLGTGTAR